MGHIVDRWTVRDADGRRVPGPRHANGRRWLARWTDPAGTERAKAFTTKDAALAHLAHVTVEMNRGAYVTPTRVTVAEYVAQWLPRQIHQRPSTAAQAESRLRVHVLPAVGHLRLSDVTRGHIQDLLAGTDLAASSTHTLYAYLRAVFASAVDDGLIAATPCRKVQLPKIPKRQLDPLTVAEVAELAERMQPHLRGMVWLGAGTGMRPGELRGVTLDRVRDRAIVVDRQLLDDSRTHRPVWGPLKTDSSIRRLPLAPATWERLQEHLEAFPPAGHGLVFATARRTPLRRGTLDYAWKAADGRGRGWHELRHHHASLLIAAGLSARAVADRLGHADPAETLRTYSHLWPTDSERILEAIAAAHPVDGQTGGVGGPE